MVCFQRPRALFALRGVLRGAWRGFGTVSAVVLALLLCVYPAQAQQSLPGGFTSEQVEGMEQIIRQYLLDNPEVLIEALNSYQRRQRLAEEETQRNAVLASLATLKNDADSPVLGNLEGDVTIVEFMDYRCGYCRRVVKDLKKTVEEDGNVRLVLKEFPILGPASVRAAKAALAAAKQDKYEAYHYALMTQPGDMSNPHLMQVALDLGLDLEQWNTDRESEEIETMIARNHALARKLGIGGTPAFIFGETLVPGAIDAEAMRDLIDEARAKAS